MGIISDWKEEFRKACVRMAKESLDSVYFPDRGYVKWLSGKECKRCGKKGIFSGYNLEYGKFYECAIADYCPKCGSVNVIETDVNFARNDQERFLPIMKKKLIEDHGLRSGIKKADSCPECGGQCLSYEKDLGVVDYQINTWTICINPNCNWPGNHKEKFASELL